MDGYGAASDAITERVQNMRAHFAFEMLRERPMIDKVFAETETAMSMLEGVAEHPGEVIMPPADKGINKGVLNIAAGAMDACAIDLADAGEYRAAAWASWTARRWGEWAQALP